MLAVLLTIDLIFGCLAIVAISLATVVWFGYWIFELSLRMFNLREVVIRAYADRLRGRSRVIAPKPL